jgi:hypothetical protein
VYLIQTPGFDISSEPYEGSLIKTKQSSSATGAGFVRAAAAGCPLPPYTIQLEAVRNALSWVLMTQHVMIINLRLH